MFFNSIDIVQPMCANGRTCYDPGYDIYISLLAYYTI